mmetsp:Transcript_146337/g.364953  ORF Transcript_146337/g.364953 Transcript_146337/m.364953 type:complete len:298 (+) Transcript_146337:1935-2828(+)
MPEPAERSSAMARSTASSMAGTGAKPSAKCNSSIGLRAAWDEDESMSFGSNSSMFARQRSSRRSKGGGIWTKVSTSLLSTPCSTKLNASCKAPLPSRTNFKAETEMLVVFAKASFKRETGAPPSTICDKTSSPETRCTVNSISGPALRRLSLTACAASGREPHAHSARASEAAFKACSVAAACARSLSTPSCSAARSPPRASQATESKGASSQAMQKSSSSALASAQAEGAGGLPSASARAACARLAAVPHSATARQKPRRAAAGGLLSRSALSDHFCSPRDTSNSASISAALATPG